MVYSSKSMIYTSYVNWPVMLVALIAKGDVCCSVQTLKNRQAGRQVVSSIFLFLFLSSPFNPHFFPFPSLFIL